LPGLEAKPEQSLAALSFIDAPWFRGRRHWPLSGGQHEISAVWLDRQRGVLGEQCATGFFVKPGVEREPGTS
jgi:hypothetical protein